MYDEACLAVPTETGLRLLQHIKGYVNTADYTIHFKVSELASIFKCSTKSLRTAINKLLEGDYLYRIANEYYMVNPGMFWISSMNDVTWQECREQYATYHTIIVDGKRIPLPTN